jgi:hypothetical protein
MTAATIIGPVTARIFISNQVGSNRGFNHRMSNIFERGARFVLAS